MKRLSRSGSTERNSDFENNDKEKRPINGVPKKEKLAFIKDYLIDYTENCNLHGLKYIGEKNCTTVEKIFWAIMFTCSVVLCAILIRKILIKWNESPVIVTFAEKTTPVWQIPYPAVTICSETKAMPDKYNFTKYYHLYKGGTLYSNLTDEEKDMFEHISMVCGIPIFEGEGKNVSVDKIIEVAPTTRDMFVNCKWNQEIYNCEDLFPPMITKKGLCYTFNTLDAEDLFRTENLDPGYQYLKQRNLTQAWTLDTGYAKSAPSSVEIYPRRSYGYGIAEGLQLFLRAIKEEVDYLCSGPIQGFKVSISRICLYLFSSRCLLMLENNILLNNPAELPRLSNHYIRIPLSHEVLVAVKPKMLTTSEGLRHYDAERRQCYFQDQRYLSYFKVYTQNNCEMECLTNFTYVRCGCVHFGMPHGRHMKVCVLSEMRCVKIARNELMTLDMESEEMDSDSDTLIEARAVASQCKCLPACTSIEYEAETSQANFDWKGYFNALGIKTDLDHFEESYSGSMVAIYFKEPQFITSRRSELYGQTDFLANCGGLLGLFMGFSILSVAEIVYFLTLRLWCLLTPRVRGSQTEHKATC